MILLRNYGRNYKKHLEARGAMLVFLNTDPLKSEWFSDVCNKAQKLAGERKVVEFEFNGVRVQVNGTTNLEHLRRDYTMALSSNWTHIGPDPVKKYDARLSRKFKKVMEEENRR